MSDQSGSLEAIARALANSMAPLEKLDAANAELVVRDLGLPFPAGLGGNAGFVASLKTIARSAADLSPLVEELLSAIAAENVVDIVARGAAVISAIGRTIQGVKTLDGTIPGFSGALLDYLFVRYGEAAVPATTNVLAFFGLFDRKHVPVPAGESPIVLRSIHFDRLGPLLKDPNKYLGDLIQWGKPGFNGAALFDRLSDALVDAPYPITPGTIGGAPGLKSLLFDISLVPASGSLGAGVGIDVHLPVENALSLDFPLGTPGWSIHVSTTAKMVAGTRITVRAPAAVEIKPPTGTIDGSLLAEVVASAVPPAAAVVLLSAAGGTRLQAESFRAGVRLTARWDATANHATADPLISFVVSGGKLHIDTSKGDGFISKLTSGLTVDADFQLSVSWSLSEGVKFQGTAGLVIQIPIHLSLGPIEVPDLYLSVGIQPDGCPIEVSATLKAALGPLNAIVERLGVLAKLSFPPGRNGNLGLLQFDMGFKPPNGIGLSLDVGVVKGGGYLYLDFEKEEYAGALELAVMDIVTVKAIGLVTTRLPDGSKGFSLLIIISAEFTGGIQLGFGFTLNGLGGLLGLNRTMQLEVIATGVRTGGINSIMFPKDIIANAQRIISDLRSYFPPQEGHFLIGLMAKIGWGTPTLASLSLGVIVEIPPGKVAILGILKVALPAEEAALIIIQVNFIGAIEPDKERLWFFAELFESRVLFIPIEGGMGLLVAWGNNANFVLSVGGFHPRFNPPALPFPVPKRVAFDIYNTPLSRIRVEAYFAVTSNTVQFGAHVEMRLGLDEIGIFGHVAFDALFQFSPFYFIIEISGSVELKVFGLGLFSIRLDFSLEGPTPWRAKGSGTLSLLFFDVSADFDITWGDKEDTSLPPIEVLPILVAEFKKTENWRAQLPKSNNLLVSLRPIEETAGLVLHPVGSLLISQRGVPLDLDIAKVGSQKISDAKRFTVVSTTTDLDKKGDRQEPFALGQFLDLSNDEKLSRKAYETKNSGLELSVAGHQAVASRAVKRIVRYEMTVIDSKYKKQLFKFFAFSGTLFRHFLRGNAAARSPLSRATEKMFVPFEDKVAVRQEGYAVATNFNNKAVSGGTAFFDSQSAAFDFMNAQTAANPNLGEVLHVIPAHEALTH